LEANVADHNADPESDSLTVLLIPPLFEELCAK
jgi:hypothetical protein